MDYGCSVKFKNYFQNNGKGNDNPHIIHNERLNCDVQVYHREMSEYRFDEADRQINAAINKFIEVVDPVVQGEKQIFKMYIFDDSYDYKYIGKCVGLGSEGGMTYYIGRDGIQSEMYVFQQGQALNLMHEMTHGLCGYVSCDQGHLPTIFTEGIADFFQFCAADSSRNDSASRKLDSARDIIEDKHLTMNDIMNMAYSEDSKENSETYSVGYALVSYMQDQDNSFCKKLLESCAQGNHQEFIESKIDFSVEEFTKWLSDNSLDKPMGEINALKVVLGDQINTVPLVDERYPDPRTFYEADIDKMDGDKVGKFSTVSYYFSGGNLRNSYVPTDDILDMGQEFAFLKLVKDPEHNYKFVNCDSDGNQFIDNRSYKFSSDRILEKYNNDPKVADIILNKMTYIDTDFIKGIDFDDAFSQGKIFALKAYGMENNPLLKHKQYHAVSVYDEDTKIAELNHDVGYFAEMKGVKDFIYQDFPLNLYTMYRDSTAYIGIDLENGETRASFISGSKAVKDLYHDKEHIHRSELINPDIHNIDLNHDVMLKGVKFLDDHKSKAAQYTNDRIENGQIVKRTTLFDNRGTANTEDDVYGAQVLEKGKVVHSFDNKGFYMSGDGDFFIQDYDSDIRFQLPKAITHLKLADHNGLKLVPCSSDGEEFPLGMPEGMRSENDQISELRYINPLSAHVYEHLDHKTFSTDIRLINFNKYKDELGEPIFKLKFHDVRNDSDSKNGSSTTSANQGSRYSRFSEVELIYTKDGEDFEIGMLANSANHYRGDIFFSFDFGYSFNDFLASVSPDIKVKNLDDGRTVIYFDASDGDIDGTDTGYTQYYQLVVAESENHGNEYYIL